MENERGLRRGWGRLCDGGSLWRVALTSLKYEENEGLGGGSDSRAGMSEEGLESEDEKK